ncbi:MAG: hypothetical protein R2730_01030 [Chitinophagales bacterium]
MDYSDDIQAQIEAYLQGRLQGDELTQFESSLKADESLALQVSQFKEVMDVLQDDSWSLTDFQADHPKAKAYLDFYLKDANKSYYNQLEALSNAEEEKTVKSNINIRAIWSVASIAAVLVICFLIFRPTPSIDHNALYSEYKNLDDIPTFVDRGSNDSVLSLIEKSFSEKDYGRTNEIISMYEAQFPSELSDQIHIYKAITYTETGKFDQAANLLSDQSIFSQSIYDQMSQWFLALNYLKANDINEARKILKEITRDKQHYKYKEAKTLLRKLK